MVLFFLLRNKPVGNSNVTPTAAPTGSVNDDKDVTKEPTATAEPTITEAPTSTATPEPMLAPDKMMVEIRKSGQKVFSVYIDKITNKCYSKNRLGNPKRFALN